MTQDINRSASVEALAALSYDEILARLAALHHSLEQASMALARLSNRRAGLLERAGVAEFPKLTRKVGEKVQRRNPGFMTPERMELVKLNSRLWGIFNRSSTLAALEQLRSDYRIYLEEAGYVAAEDRDLWHLHDQQAQFRDEQYRLQQLEIMHPVHRLAEKTPLGNPEGVEGKATIAKSAVAQVATV